MNLKRKTDKKSHYDRAPGIWMMDLQNAIKKNTQQQIFAKTKLHLRKFTLE